MVIVFGGGGRYLFSRNVVIHFNSPRSTIGLPRRRAPPATVIGRPFHARHLFCRQLQGVECYARRRGTLLVRFRQGAEERMSASFPSSMRQEAAGILGVQQDREAQSP